MTRSEHLVDVEGIAVRLTSLDRVLFPSVGFTKRDLVEYYTRVAEFVLPHVAGRPMTLHRFPEGVDATSFFQTRAPSHPSWIRVQRMHTFHADKTVDTVVLDNRAGLVWAANLSTIELHPYLVRADRLQEPTELVFDLDPGAPATILDACAIALVVRDALEAGGVRAYAKVTGGVGIHVVVPLATGHTFDQTKSVARHLAQALTRAYPDRVTDLMARQRRPGRVFVDWSQNDPGKSTVAPYSLRGRHVPAVALPVAWDAVEYAVDAQDPRGLVFTPDGALAELERGDALADLAPQTLLSPVDTGTTSS
ncbi:MAG: bifunctional non-ous end joining protein LigD [Actinomycetota bacterium]